MQIAPSWIDIVVVFGTIVNAWLALRMKAMMTEMKLYMSEKYLTKDDFREWTRRAPSVPDFHEDKFNKTVRRA
jgi:hypothetical protein